MSLHPQGPNSCTLNKTKSIALVYVNATKQHVINP